MQTNTLEDLVAHMDVCGVCGELSGVFVDVESETPRTQRCACRTGKGRDEELWPRHDFNRVVELCRCCAGSLVASGSRWSSFLCDDCTADVIAWNRSRSGGIPVARHPLANEIGWSSRPEDPVEPKRELILQAPFPRRVHGLWARFAYLDLWRAQRAREVLASMERVTSSTAYLAVADAGPSRSDIFAALTSYFDTRAEERDASGRRVQRERPRARVG